MRIWSRSSLVVIAALVLFLGVSPAGGASLEAQAKKLRAGAERAERGRLRLRARLPDLPTLLPRVAGAAGRTPEALQGAGAAVPWPGPAKASRISGSRSSGTAETS